ncbi:MAG: TraB/GumN family protein [Bacteroidales bacterium]|nr:TraB/GumN family protein [Bacteroidales bacterium]MBR5014692.1 TraB/GumN family protein [Bacteroidales bacterium]
MKRILTLLALSLLCLTSNAQLVWKISGNGIKKPSYILGTHHGCPFTYCDSIPGLMKAFDKVDNIIGEINMIELAEMSPERMQKMQAMMMMPADTSLLSLFSTEEAAKVNEWLGKKMGASLEMLSVMKPMTIMVTVQNKEMMEVIPEVADMTTIDKYMQTLGQRKGKTIGELETADYQMELLYGNSLEEQADALLEMIDHEDSKGLLQQLTSAYKSQNLDTLWKVFQEQMTGYEYDAIVKVRNLNWEKQMKEILPKQTTLFVVGAGHLPGEYGMINLLREAGYKVKPVKK